MRFAPRTLESSWPYLIISSHSVLWLAGMTYICSMSLWILARTWNIKLQTLSVEDLIVIEPRRSMIKTDILAWEHFIIHRSFFSCPFSSSIFKIVLTFFFGSNDVFYSILSKQGTLPKLRVITNFFLLFRVQNSDVRTRFFQTIESFGGAHEDTIRFRPLFLCGGPCSCGSLTLSFDC